MKKISLKNFNLSDVELLSREELKNVIGGDGPPPPPPTGGSDTCDCNNDSACSQNPSEPLKVIACMACNGDQTNYLGHCAWNGEAPK